MTWTFTKMQGLGNDFVVVSRSALPEDAPERARALCDRHFGVGADGLVFVLPSEKADVAMRIFNPDGTEAEQCGNAVRCVARYFFERISGEKRELTVETRAGLQRVELEVSKGRVVAVCVDMGRPILQGREIPTAVDRERVVEEPLEVDGARFRFTAVSMGNPHAVVQVEDAPSFPVEEWGPRLETHPLFPRKTNVEFITVRSPREIDMRVWERGVGQTLACGSGACAALVAAVLTGKAEREATVHLLGGDLHIRWDEESDRVFMTGPAEFVFEGEWPGFE
ncbi:diaminopimelate epimerase [Planifilum fimeticola]